MADVKPLRAFHYNLDTVGSLTDVTAPPYDIIGPAEREKLTAKSQYNVVHVDLPMGEDPYAEAALTIGRWQHEKALIRDGSPAIWLLSQRYRTQDGNERTRHGILARVRAEQYGPGKIRPHERTHAGPIRDRLELTRATHLNLSPIFSLYSDPSLEIWGPLAQFTEAPPWDSVTDSEGTNHTIWRVGDEDAINAACALFREKELLIADGHHRYETAMAYANEVSGEGDHNYTLMCLVAMEDPGLELLPTHRVICGPNSERGLQDAIERSFDIEDVEMNAIVPPADEASPPTFGFIASERMKPQILKLKSQELADSALAAHSNAYRSLDTAILEELVFRRALGEGQEDLVAHGQLSYVTGAAEAIAMVRDGHACAAFFLRPPAIAQVRAITEAGETMPPKSTYFYPKLLTGLLFNPLD